jgi:hypothetical protein
MEGLLPSSGDIKVDGNKGKGEGSNSFIHSFIQFIHRLTHSLPPLKVTKLLYIGMEATDGRAWRQH